MGGGDPIGPSSRGVQTVGQHRVSPPGVGVGGVLPPHWGHWLRAAQGELCGDGCRWGGTHRTPPHLAHCSWSRSSLDSTAVV